jgi:Kef-type K+ transport system membrane component KefB
MPYLLKPLVRALRTMNERELKLSFILGFLLFVAGILDVLHWSGLD